MLTAKILLRRLQRQEDLRLKIFGPPLAGTRGGLKEEGGPSHPPPPPRDAFEWGEVPPSTAPSLHPAAVPLTASARPQPLWHPPPTACLTASGAASEVSSPLMHPCPPLQTPPNTSLDRGSSKYERADITNRHHNTNARMVLCVGRVPNFAAKTGTTKVCQLMPRCCQLRTHVFSVSLLALWACAFPLCEDVGSTGRLCQAPSLQERTAPNQRPRGHNRPLSRSVGVGAQSAHLVPHFSVVFEICENFPRTKFRRSKCRTSQSPPPPKMDFLPFP